MTEERVEWNDAERRALGALGAETEPPPGVEERVVAELARRGGFIPRSRPSRSFFRALLAAAAALLVFAAGLAFGRREAALRSPAADEPRFALFLLDEPAGGAAEEPARVSEYKRWARSLPGGVFVAGEKLGSEARLLTPASSEPARGSDAEDAIRGYFVIRAPDLARALEVARTCPHLKRGGRILVRPIVPV
jgi:hypothetical protein